jgi:hypothetical protein
MTRGRPSGEKTRCGGKWTEARYRSFVKGNLRSATRKWGPIQECRKGASTRRGFYRCAGCGEEVTATVVIERSRVNNIFVDHIEPIVDPSVGFTTWDNVIEGMFCEIENLQVLCKACHDGKCLEEKELAKLRKLNKEDDEEF